MDDQNNTMIPTNHEEPRRIPSLRWDNDIKKLAGTTIAQIAKDRQQWPQMEEHNIKKAPMGKIVWKFYFFIMFFILKYLFFLIVLKFFKAYFNCFFL